MLTYIIIHHTSTKTIDFTIYVPVSILRVKNHLTLSNLPTFLSRRNIKHDILNNKKNISSKIEMQKIKKKNERTNEI